MTSKFSTPIQTFDLSPADRAQAGAGRFILRLCAVAAPVSIRSPQSAHLRPFTFFLSRECQADGCERLYLNMGYFDTMADAQRWAESARRRFPSAIASIAPGAPSRQAGSEASESPSAAALLPRSGGFAPVKDGSLTDSQIFKILETRHVSTPRDGAGDRDIDQIELLRPDDTVTRQALKEAVVQGAPICFAVQLRWSAQPIDLSHVRPLAIFKTHTLYATESRRKGRSRHFLRLGFFADPISAKQVAVQVRSSFGSAAVVPVVESEVARAREALVGTTAMPYLVEQHVDQLSSYNDAPESPAGSQHLTHRPRGVLGNAETFKEAPLAERDAWTGSDPLSESGVRHLRIQVQEHLSGRWRTIRLGDAPSDEVQYRS